MEAFKNKAFALLKGQEVRITAALQLLMCCFALVLAVKGDLKAYQKKRMKAARKKKRNG